MGLPLASWDPGVISPHSRIATPLEFPNPGTPSAASCPTPIHKLFLSIYLMLSLCSVSWCLFLCVFFFLSLPLSFPLISLPFSFSSLPAPFSLLPSTPLSSPLFQFLAHSRRLKARQWQDHQPLAAVSSISPACPLPTSSFLGSPTSPFLRAQSPKTENVFYTYLQGFGEIGVA